MIYKQDWIMRQIETMIDGLIRLFTNTDSFSGDERMLASDSFQVEDDAFAIRVFSFLKSGKICEAENLIFQELQPDDRHHFEIALRFYKQLNEMDEKTLQAQNFSHEEVASGLRALAKKYGIDIDALF